MPPHGGHRDWRLARMREVELRRALDEAQRNFAKRFNVLDAAMRDALGANAADMVERLRAAKAARDRGERCLIKLRGALLEFNR